MRPAKGEVTRNLDAIRGLVATESGRLDLLVFPEAAVTGYFLEGGVREAGLEAERLVEAIGCPPEGSPDVVIGFFESSHGRIFNSAIHLTPAGDEYEVVHLHRKVFLPNYGLFEEARFVDPGTEFRAYESRFGKMGLLVCEDAWHTLPPAILALGGAELVLVPSASPARDFRPGGGMPGNLRQWDALATGAAREHGIFVAVCQLVGSEGGKLFHGGSILAGPDGTIRTRGPLLEEGVVTAEIGSEEIERARARVPLLSDLEERLPILERELERVGIRADRQNPEGELGIRQPRTGSSGLGRRAARSDGGAVGSGISGIDGPQPGEVGPLELDLDLVEHSLVEFIRDEVRGRGFERVVIGVSGGVDSAVVLLLATRALGAENVFGFRLPYATSSQESLDHAALVLNQSGASEETIEITGPVDAYLASQSEELSPLRKGNVAARMRAITLFDQSARLRALPLGTGNKSERLLGYFTWHADDSPPINPIGDLLKTQVWALARHLGVPDTIVEKPATADLVRGVTDEDELGIAYHCADPILHWLLEGHSATALIESGFDSAEIEIVCRRLDSTHWKRELPAVAMLSSSAIGESYLRPLDYLGRRGVPARGPSDGAEPVSDSSTVGD